MFEDIVTKITKLEKDGKTIGKLTTMIATSHYGHPEWSGCDEELNIGDEIIISDSCGGPQWKAKVVGIDPHDGWVLVETEDCEDCYYAIHPDNGWINSIEGAEGLETAEEIISGLNNGTVKLQYGIRLGEGWGCL